MQKTKKNWVLRMMVLALMLTLLSTCLMSGTLAKYTSVATGSDNARVAKWGIGETMTFNLFDYADTGVYGTPGNAVGADTAKLIAPGTKNSSGFGITGTPEVAFSLAVTITAQYTVDGVVAAWPNDYYPLQFSTNGTTWGDLTALTTELTGSIAGNYPAGTNLSTLTGTIYWQWPMTDDDAKDTALGNYAASTGELGVQITVTLTATQLDTI